MKSYYYEQVIDGTETRRCIRVAGILLYRKHNLRRKQPKRATTDFVVPENTANALCFYRAFSYYVAKVDPKLRSGKTLSVFLDPKEANWESPIWYKSNMVKSKLRNMFTPLKTLIQKTDPEFDWQRVCYRQGVKL